MICKNCEQNFNGKYCEECGQKSDVKRVDFNYIINEIPDSILQINQGFFFTIKELTLRPGRSVQNFLTGKRKPYYKPFSFFLVTATVYFLLAYLLERDTIIDDFISGFNNGMTDSNETSGISVLEWISKNQTYSILLLIPFFSIATYLAFLQSKYNYFEHVVINLYITGYQMIIYLIFGFVFVQENVLLIVPVLLGFIYNIWVFNQLFAEKKFMKRTFLMILIYVNFIVLLFLTLTIVAVIQKLIS